jgi:hypothetical protein
MAGTTRSDRRRPVDPVVTGRHIGMASRATVRVAFTPEDLAFAAAVRVVAREALAFGKRFVHHSVGVRLRRMAEGAQLLATSDRGELVLRRIRQGVTPIAPVHTHRAVKEGL